MNTKSFRVNDFEPHLAIPGKNSKLRARPQTEPSCKGLALCYSLSVKNSICQGSLLSDCGTNSQGYKKSEAAARPPLAEIGHLQGIENLGTTSHRQQIQMQEIQRVILLQDVYKFDSPF